LLQRGDPSGSYDFTRWRLEAQTSEQPSFQFGATTVRNLLQRALTQWQNYLKWTSPKGRIQLDLEMEMTLGTCRWAIVVQRLWSVQAAYAWNPNLVLSSFVQYDTESQNVGTNTPIAVDDQAGQRFVCCFGTRLATHHDRPTVSLVHRVI